MFEPTFGCGAFFVLMLVGYVLMSIRVVKEYERLHPGGAWRGENAIYIGRDGEGFQRWSGLGASYLTERDMAMTLAREAATAGLRRAQRCILSQGVARRALIERSSRNRRRSSARSWAFW